VPEFDDLPADAISAAEAAVIDFGVIKNLTFGEFGLSVFDAGDTEGVIE